MKVREEISAQLPSVSTSNMSLGGLTSKEKLGNNISSISMNISMNRKNPSMRKRPTRILVLQL